jgi:hypothetical protein
LQVFTASLSATALLWAFQTLPQPCIATPIA